MPPLPLPPPLESVVVGGVVVRLETKGWLNMEMGILAFKTGFLSSWSLNDSFMSFFSISSCSLLVGYRRKEESAERGKMNPISKLKSMNLIGL